ncbi:unnamed protein product [Calicophoron daubneyi]|uniref:Daxx histone-binding domain-containing protein n=1 Tax=Calicophoron daubneyi TaxID=300641 RepID=A0AAV2TZ96_CALDB
MSWMHFERKLRRHLSSSDEEIVALLKRKYYRTSKEFQQSELCRETLRKCAEDISNSPGRLYVILNNLKSNLKLHGVAPNSGKSSRSSSKEPGSTELGGRLSDHSQQNSTPFVISGSSSPSIKANDTDDDVIIIDSPRTSREPSSGDQDCRSVSISSESHSCDVAGTAPGSSDSDERRRSLISRLERLLSRLNTEIRKREEDELDFDALESNTSSYMQLDVLKRRYLEVWRRLCEARKIARISGRILRRRFSYNGCKYANVNLRIENLVNCRKEFPDFTDIRQIVSAVNEEEHLQLSSCAVTALAREVFVDVGHMLKQRRQDDLRHDFGCHLTDDLREEEDPTYSDPDLRRQLAENKHLGDAKLKSVFDKFVQLQYAQSLDSSHSKCEDSRSEETESLSDTKRDMSPRRPLSPVPSAASASCDVLSVSSDSETEDPPLVRTDAQIHSSSPLSGSKADSALCSDSPDQSSDEVIVISERNISEGESQSRSEDADYTSPSTQPTINLLDDDVGEADQINSMLVSRVPSLPSVDSRVLSTYPILPAPPMLRPLRPPLLSQPNGNNFSCQLSLNVFCQNSNGLTSRQVSHSSQVVEMTTRMCGPNGFGVQHCRKTQSFYHQNHAPNVPHPLYPFLPNPFPPFPFLGQQQSVHDYGLCPNLGAYGFCSPLLSNSSDPLRLSSTSTSSATVDLTANSSPTSDSETIVLD